jgi:transposase
LCFTYTPQNRHNIAKHSFGKRELRYLRQKIRQKQREIAKYEQRKQFTPTDPKYLKLCQQLSRRHQRVNRLITELARMAAVKTSHLLFALQAQYPDTPIRMLVEDLRWTRASSRCAVGQFLAHTQILFMHRQYQAFLAHFLRFRGIGVWRVSAKNTSQHCALCGSTRPKQRQGSTFRCRNPAHTLDDPSPSRQRPYTTNADLNAARNIALARPLSLI